MATYLSSVESICEHIRMYYQYYHGDVFLEFIQDQSSPGIILKIQRLYETNTNPFYITFSYGMLIEIDVKKDIPNLVKYIESEITFDKCVEVMKKALSI